MEISNDSDLQPPFFAGIDVGGTSIKLGLLDGRGTPLASSRFRTESQLGPANAVQRMSQHLDELIMQSGFTSSDVLAIGLGTPGTMDIKRGMILEPPNLPGWRHFAIQKALRERTGKPVTFVNDANAAAYGEYWVGKARELHVMVLLTLGTGVGGGLVIDDELIEGSTGNAAEFGHMTIDYSSDARRCSCGHPGHLEAYASATGVAMRARELAGSNPSSKLARQEVPVAELTAKHVSLAAELDDRVAAQVIDETAEFLARGITLLAHAFDPDSVLLGGAMDFGGGTSAVGSRFIESIRLRVRESCISATGDNVQIDFASLGPDAGWIGAAGLAKRRYDLAT